MAVDLQTAFGEVELNDYGYSLDFNLSESITAEFMVPDITDPDDLAGGATIRMVAGTATTTLIRTK